MTPEATLAAERDKAIAENSGKTDPGKPVEKAAAQNPHPPVVADQARDADATAAITAEPPKEPEHPAIAQLRGAGAQAGHSIDVTDADRSELPVFPVVVDEMHRVWKLVRVGDKEYLVLVGELVH